MVIRVEAHKPSTEYALWSGRVTVSYNMLSWIVVWVE